MKRSRAKQLLQRGLTVLLFAALCSVTALAAADAAHPLEKTGTTGVSVNYLVDAGNEWQYDSAYSDAAHNAYKAGNSGKSGAGVSNIAITVTQPGILSFDYRISTGNFGGNYALYYRLNSAITAENFSTAANANQVASYCGTVPWTHQEITITPADLVNGSATLYIAYYRGGTDLTGDNKVTIANVGFLYGEKTFTLGVTGGEFGSVTGAAVGESRHHVGTVLTLTAEPTAAGSFYGWLDGRGNFRSNQLSFQTKMMDSDSVTAVFAAKDSYLVRRGSAFYTAAGGGLARALQDAQHGDKLMLLENQTLTADATVPAGVSLYIPYDRSYDEDGSADGASTAKPGDTNKASLVLADANQVYRTLTIDPGVTLTIQGSVTVGSVISYPAMNGYQGHTSGAFGKIANNGSIVVAGGAVLDSWGIVDGSGTVTVESGGKAYEPFIVVDFVGGSNTAELYFDNQSPFRHWAVQNIQNKLTLQPGSVLLVHCNLFAGSAYNKTDVQFISTSGLFQVEPTTKVVRTYDGTKHTENCPDLGLTTYTISGGMNFRAMNMFVAGFNVTTENVDFPIPYNIHFVMESGSYTVPRRLKLMPGCRFTVADGATLTVKGESFMADGAATKPALFVHNGMRQDPMSGKGYPTSEQLKAAGYSQSGELMINGNFVVQSGAIFGGIVQTAGSTGTMTLEPGVTLETPRLQDGTKGAYDNNISLCAISARGYMGGNMVPLTAGSYQAEAATGWTLPSYTSKYMVSATKAEYDAFNAIVPKVTDPDDDQYVDFISSSTYHKWKTETVACNQPMQGSWKAGQAGSYTISTVNKTVYDANDATRTVITGAELKPNNSIVFQVAKTAVGKGYTWIAEYQMSGDNAPTKIDCVDGIYTITGVNANITITVTAVKLGDVNGDGKIVAADALFVLRIANGSLVANDLQKIAANANADAKITAADALFVLRIANGSYQPT